MDGMLLASRAVRHSCVAKWVQETYRQPFGVEPQSDTIVWLDMVLTAHMDAAPWQPTNANRAWIHGQGVKVSERCPPFLGRLQASFGSLRGRFLGRAARLREMELSERGRAMALCEDVQELLMVGHPWKFIRKLVHSLGVGCSEFLHLQSAVRASMTLLRPSG